MAFLDVLDHCFLLKQNTTQRHSIQHNTPHVLMASTPSCLLSLTALHVLEEVFCFVFYCFFPFSWAHNMYNYSLIWFNTLIPSFSITFSAFFSSYLVSWFGVFTSEISPSSIPLSSLHLFSAQLLQCLLSTIHLPSKSSIHWHYQFLTLSHLPRLHFCPCPP